LRHYTLRSTTPSKALAEDGTSLFRCLALAAGNLDRLPDCRRGRRHVEVRHAEREEHVDERVHQGG